jgi:bacillithiol biosynthesis deacetylase BshB1
MKLDVLAFGAHPDDIELAVGGTLSKLADLGYQTGVVDMVRGELGTRGTPQTRAREARVAAKVMGLAVRDNLKLRDGQILVSQETRLKVIAALRKYRPELVLTHYWEDNHPDHVYTSRLITECCYLSGLAKIKTGQERHRPGQLLYFKLPFGVLPTFVVDISSHFEKKMAAIRCYQSQLHDPKSSEPQTYLSIPDFLPRVESLHRYYGYLVRSQFAEAFFSRQALLVEDPVALFRKSKNIRFKEEI